MKRLILGDILTLLSLSKMLAAVRLMVYPQTVGTWMTMRAAQQQSFGSHKGGSTKAQGNLNGFSRKAVIAEADSLF